MVAGDRASMSNVVVQQKTRPSTMKEDVGRMKMSHVKIRILQGCMGLALLALVISFVSCNKSEKPATTEGVQKTFTAPDGAAKALVEAAKTGNRDALVAIFGPGSQDVIFSGDATQDKTSFENFVAAYTAMNRWRNQTDGSEVLVVGADNNPFPNSAEEEQRRAVVFRHRQPGKTRSFHGVLAITNWPPWT